MIASSNSSPPVRMDSAITIPPNEMTAISVVPPPMSTIIFPAGSLIGILAPIAAARASSIKKFLSHLLVLQTREQHVFLPL